MENKENQVLIETKRLKKYFSVPAGHLHAVDDVNLTINKGETLGIVGESGCGKSTLGRVILRLHEATSGDVLYDGMDINNFTADEMRHMRQNMQIIFQDPYASLNPRMTIGQIIEEPLILHKMYKTAEERRARVEELMELVGLPLRSYNQYPHEFDGGRRQRVVIARALSINPQFIVCDEPVSALDVSIQAQVINMFEELQQDMGLTYLFIAHDLLVVRHISNRIAVMYLGKMVELTDANEIYERPLHPYSKALMSAVPMPDPKIARLNNRIPLSGDIPSPLNAPSGCPFRTRCEYACERCAEEVPEFREISKGHFVACHRVEEING